MDNRIQLTNEPTTTTTKGQLSDTYPNAEDPPRYDLMKSYLIGLLTHQSGTEQPTEYREGTLWYNLQQIKINLTDQWHPLTTILNLPTITQPPQKAHYSGKTTQQTTTIPIPEKLQQTTGWKYTIWVNGLLWQTGQITECTINLQNPTPENSRYTTLLTEY